MVWLWVTMAWAGPDRALGVDAGVSTAEQGGSVSGRLRWDSGWQLGLRGYAARVTTGFVDGFEVRGARGVGTVGLTVPLVKRDAVQVDIEVDAGAQALVPEAGADIEETGIGIVADVSPMVTLPVAGGALRLGWRNVFHQQLTPSVALDAQGALIRAEGVIPVGDDLQVTVRGETGGVFGFGGDGGKYLAGARLGLRWVPGAASTWLNH